jgi:glycosyltransferase involved in cell wall biosynthesis
VHLSVAICTWNRARLLDQTLTHLKDLAIPEGVQWEVLVVNNRSTDETEEVLARHETLLPLRRLYEAVQGQSNARNAAVRAARGDLILWTDDDVIVDPRWLAEYAGAARAWPDVSFFGGTIAPWFETQPPSWMTAAWPHVSAAYAARELGESSFDVDPRSMPYGANYAIRTDAQRCYRYDPNLGLSGGQSRRGEETALMLRMMRDGHRGRFIPGARVRHFIPRERITLEYVREWFFGLGQTHVEQDVRDGVLSGGKFRSLVWIWFWLNGAYAAARFRWARRNGPPERWVRCATYASYCRGRCARRGKGGEGEKGRRGEEM